MKTVKTLTIIFGLVVGMIGFVSTTVKADDLAKANKITKVKEAKVAMKIYDAKMQETENLLIENYLQMVDYESKETLVTIVNEAGSTVYSGTKEDAEDLLKISDYLFSFGEKEHYLITK
jgi:hypothetical protein